MRLVAGVARDSLRVIRRHHLGKCLWFRAVRFVAAAAHDSRIELGWFDRSWIVGVLRLRPMTGLAWNHHVPAQFLLLRNICMATFADLVPRMSDRSRRNLPNRISPVLSVLPETLRHYRGTHHYERHHSQDQYRRKAD